MNSPEHSAALAEANRQRAAARTAASGVRVRARDVAAVSGLCVLVKLSAGAPRPRFDLGPLPHFAHVKHDLGLREVAAGDELLDPLAADAEHAADLRRAHKMMHVRNHRHDATRHLTRGQEMREASHMTRELAAGSKVELKLLQLVADHNLPFETARGVICGTKSNGQSRSCTPDLLFREIRVAVFLDGCYWHRCEVHGPSDSRAVQIRAKDQGINTGLEAGGWLVLRFWEHDDLNKAADQILATVLERHAERKATDDCAQMAPCRHAPGEWCERCVYEPHTAVKGKSNDCARCELTLIGHDDDMIATISQDWDAVAYDARLLALRFYECHPVSAAEMHRVAEVAADLARQMEQVEAAR